MLQSIEFTPKTYYMPQQEIEVERYESYSNFSNWKTISDFESDVYKSFPEYTKQYFNQQISNPITCTEITSVDGKKYFKILNSTMFVNISTQLNIWLKENRNFIIRHMKYAMSISDENEISGVFIIYEL